MLETQQAGQNQWKEKQLTFRVAASRCVKYLLNDFRKDIGNNINIQSVTFNYCCYFLCPYPFNF